MNKNKTAFTTIELVVVLGIISLLVGLTTFYFFNFKAGAELRLAAEEIVASLNQARSLAITHKSTYKVVFDTINKRYEIQDSLNAQINGEHRLGKGIVFDLINFENNTVSYSSTGSTKNGRIIIKDNKSKYYTIKVVNVTGRVKILNYRELPSG